MKWKGCLLLLLSVVLMVTTLPAPVFAMGNEAATDYEYLMNESQALIDGLMEENDEAMETQFLSIDKGKAEPNVEETQQLDMARYAAILKALTFHDRKNSIAVLAENVTLSGDGTSSSPYQIGTADELATFRDLVNNGQTDAWGELTADINLNPGIIFTTDGAPSGSNPTQWTPIGNNSSNYTGTFDGGGHTLSGLYINAENDKYIGLFGFVGSNGKVQNIGLVNSYVYASTTAYAGGICGFNKGSITNCFNTGVLSGGFFLGGICGDNFGTVTNCYNSGTLSGTAANTYVGGVCASLSNGAIINCYNTALLIVNNSANAGGVCGAFSEGTIINCYYLEDTADFGIAEEYYEGAGEAIEKTMSEFENGTVLMKLRNNESGAMAWAEQNNTLPGSTLISQPVLIWQELTAALGTAQNPYRISTAAELVTFANVVNNTLTEDEKAQGFTVNPAAHAILTADIELNSGTFTTDENGNPLYNGQAVDTESQLREWTPIGSEATKYTGIFDGDGYKISGLYINNSSKSACGLFGYVGDVG